MEEADQEGFPRQGVLACTNRINIFGSFFNLPRIFSGDEMANRNFFFSQPSTFARMMQFFP